MIKILQYTSESLESLYKTGVYQIVNIFNEKSYIGSAGVIGSYPSHSGFYTRWYKHIHQLNGGRHGNSYLQNAWDKYGASNFKFKILCFCSSEECLEKEQIYLDLLSPEYNICKFAYSCAGVLRTDSEIKKIKEALQKTYQFLNKSDEVIEITNLCDYAKENNLNQSSLWMLSSGIKKTYANLKCLTEVYQNKQEQLKMELESRKTSEWLYPNMCLISHLGKIKYTVYKNENKEAVFKKICSTRKEALEYGLLISQIF
jgi:group I intron endonuclease